MSHFELKFIVVVYDARRYKRLLKLIHAVDIIILIYELDDGISTGSPLAFAFSAGRARSALSISLKT